MNHLRIILSQSASDYLTAAGEDAFVVIGKASHPSDPKRWVIHMVPVTMKQACEACEVALGTRKAGKRVPVPETPTEASTAVPDGKKGRVA